MSLKEALDDPAKKPAIIADCLTLIDDEVKDKSGFGGLALKAGYKTVSGFKPGFVKNVVEGLLPDFAEALEPLSDEAKAAGTPLGSYIQGHKGRAADAMLSVTDAKADRSTNRIVKSTYKKLRGSAKKNVESALPRLGKLIDQHA